jgi:hypothetical protein
MTSSRISKVAPNATTAPNATNIRSLLMPMVRPDCSSSLLKVSKPML